MREDNQTLAAAQLETGMAALEAGEIDLAINSLCLAIKNDRLNATAFGALGLALLSAGELADAEACLRNAVELEPEKAEHYNNLALFFMEKKEFADAEACLRLALNYEPDCAAAHNNLGLVMEELDLPDAAEAEYREAVHLQKNYSEALYNLGNLLKTKLCFTEAEIFLRRAIATRECYSEAVFSLSVMQLTQGRFKEGWPNYDAWRMKRPAAKRDPQSLRWQGEDLSGKSILLYHEQGFGDNLQFLRYLPLVAAQAKKLKVWLQPELRRLVANCYPEYELHRGDLPPEETFDFACPIPSLPAVLLSDEESVPATMPYLWAEENLRQSWRDKLGESKGRLRIGLVWAGNPGHNNDHNRSLALAKFKDLFSLEDLEWHSLQVGTKSGEAQGFPVRDWSKQLSDFAETAALVANLDLVLCVDSAVAHLAGAMRKPAWMLVPYLPDWRWQLARCDSYWYPSLRLFRQSANGDWDGVLERIKVALQEESEKFRS